MTACPSRNHPLVSTLALAVLVLAPLAGTALLGIQAPLLRNALDGGSAGLIPSTVNFGFLLGLTLALVFANGAVADPINRAVWIGKRALGVRLVIAAWSFACMFPAMVAANTAAVAERAVQVVSQARQVLGKAPPVSSQLAAVLASPATMRSHQATFGQLARARADHERVVAAVSAGQVLGNAHPAIDFISRNALVRPVDQDAIVRDLLALARTPGAAGGGQAVALATSLQQR